VRSALGPLKHSAYERISCLKPLSFNPRL
jgi:hypothetical protein